MMGARMRAQDLGLFQAALGLSEPWAVVSVEFDAASKRLDLRVDFAKGARLISRRARGSRARSAELPDTRCMTPRRRPGGTWTSSSIRRT